MKRKVFSSLICVVLCVVMVMIMIPFAQGTVETVKIVNPKGIIEAPELVSLTPRLDTLAGKRIAIVGYGKDNTGYNNYAGAIADLLHEKYGRLSTANPTGVEISVANSGSYGDVLGEKGANNYDAWVRNADAVISGLAN